MIPVATPRNELMKLLDASSSKRVIYIHAPAGYGKSFSTRMWLKRGGIPAAWVSVNESAGRKPSVFCARFVAALCSLQPENAALKEIVSHNSFPAAPFEFSERALTMFRLYADGDFSRSRYALVIDDFHLISNPVIISRFGEFLLDLPENATVCVLSRTEPSGRFSELVLKDAAAVVCADNLKFSESEVKSFFASRGQNLTDKQVCEISAATDGWAIGLNAILLSHGGTKNRRLVSRHLETFIREHIWDKWSGERRDFILRVSTEEELSADFCADVTGRLDSAEILDGLVRENAFLSVDSKNIYRFHHLFQDFLLNALERENPEKRNEIYRKARDWFFKTEDYYKAVEYGIKLGDKSGISKALKNMYNYDSLYASIQDTLNIIRKSVDNSIADEFPFLLEPLAWAAYVEGRGEDMEDYLDKYYKLFPKIVLQNPRSAITRLIVSVMDYRKSMVALTKTYGKIPFRKGAKLTTPSITQNMPFLHRSFRDLSEYVFNTAENLRFLQKTVGLFLGGEYSMVENLINAGLSYERGDLNAAYEFMLSAGVNRKESYAPEFQFCYYMLLAAILEAQGRRDDIRQILGDAEAMIETKRAYFLGDNFRAFRCRLKLSDGDAEAARDWLKHNADYQNNKLAFFKIYQYFTTARAYIAAGDLTQAILLLKKLLILCERYRRPLDITEANILLAVAYWKKAGGFQDEAIKILTSAIVSARKYGYTQVFINESGALSNMLHKLHKRVMQKDYSGELSPAEVKSLYFGALARAKHSRGLTGGTGAEKLIFTERQKTVMHYMNEGLTQKKIAEKMGLKPSGIKSHMILIYKKLDVSNITDAIIRIRESGVLENG